MVEHNQQPNIEAGSRLPWSPLSISLLAFLLPPGGALLTVWNLRRLGQVDLRSARLLSIAVGIVFIAGLIALLGLSFKNLKDPPTIGEDTRTVLSVGCAIASFLAQRAPFLKWREAHRQARTSSWLSAIGWSVLLTLLVGLFIAPGYLLLAQILLSNHLAPGHA